MSDESVHTEIELEPQEGYEERVAISEDGEDRKPSFVIYDVTTGSPGEFNASVASEGAVLRSEEALEQYNGGIYVFKLVPKEEGKFVAMSLDYFENHVSGDRHIFGLQPAPKIREQYIRWVNNSSDKFK